MSMYVKLRVRACDTCQFYQTDKCNKDKMKRRETMIRLYNSDCYKAKDDKGDKTEWI